MIEPDLSRDEAISTTPRMLRQFAGLWLIVLGAFAAWQWFGHGNGSVAAALLSAALAAGLPGLVRPASIRPLFTGLMLLTMPIGWAVSNAVLTVLLYGLITPVGLLFRLIGRDALSLRPHRELHTYWTPRRPVTDVRTYLRQS